MSGRTADDETNPWLLRRKVTLPDPVAGYLHRAELVESAMPTRQRVTVLKAPAGFGKTTLLAECCRSLGEDGVQTAWVSLDERDEPAVLDIYIAFACRSAGLDIHDRPMSGDASGVAPWSGAALVARGRRGARQSLRACARRAGPAEEPRVSGIAGISGCTAVRPTCTWR